jgi:hypothetical protein
MINNVFKYSKKRGMFGGINYLTGDKDRSVSPTYLRGNEAITRELLAAATGTRQYTTGCCSFKELESQFNSDFKNEVMDLYEETLMAGFPAEHYCMDWIEHTDKNGRLELNWHIVNQDQVTGRVLQPYYHKQDQVRIDLAKQIINDKYNLHSPDDPTYFRDAGNRNNFGDRAKNQEHIIQQISAEIEDEQIDNRQDIIEFLSAIEWIDVSRITKSSISIKIKNNDEIKKPIRFKGGIFSDKFDAGSSQYAEAKIESAQQFSEQRERRLVGNTKNLKKLNENVAKKRRHLLTAPKPNIRNTDQNKQTSKTTFRPDEPSATPINHTGEIKKQTDTEIYAADNTRAGGGHGGIGRGNLDRDVSARLKINLLNKITAQNDKYNKNIGRGRTGDTSAISGQQQRITCIIKTYVNKLRDCTKRGIERIRGFATERNSGAGESSKYIADFNEKCRTLDELINGSDGFGIGGITMKPKATPAPRKPRGMVL